MMERMKRKDNPPPYEDPPSYSVAIQMENSTTISGHEKSISDKLCTIS